METAGSVEMDSASPQLSRSSRPGRAWLRALLWLSVLMLLAAAIMLVVNPFKTASYDPRARILGFVPYTIANNAMAPAIRRGDIVVVRTWVYRTAAPQRGDVIVFNYPPNPDQVYIKRVIGIPGDRVAIRDDKLWLDREAKSPAAASDDEQTETALAHQAANVIPADSYYVLGDNRANSSDSRYWGYVPRANIIGRADAIWSAGDPARIGPIKGISP